MKIAEDETLRDFNKRVNASLPILKHDDRVQSSTKKQKSKARLLKLKQRGKKQEHADFAGEEVRRMGDVVMEPPKFSAPAKIKSKAAIQK